MAIARLGSVVAGISGTIGGVTFTSGRSGVRVGQRRRWVDGATAASMTRRAGLSVLGRWWRELSEEQRAAWRAVAENTGVRDRLGVGGLRSGFRWFCLQNAQGYIKVSAPYPDAPTMRASTAVLTATLTAEDDGTVEISGVTPVLPADAFMYVRGSATPKGISGQVWRTGRLIGQFGGGVDPNPTYEVGTEWVRDIGSLQVGDRVGVWLVRHEEGLLPSPELRVETVVV